MRTIWIQGSMSEDGTVVVPLGETFWAARFGVLADKFGVSWSTNCEKPEAA